jgi:hypothetical protein
VEIRELQEEGENERESEEEDENEDEVEDEEEDENEDEDQEENWNWLFKFYKQRKQQPAKCYICKKEYKNLNGLMNHRAIHNVNSRANVEGYCKICDKNFKLIGQHIARFHAYKRFKCASCLFKTNAKYDLKIHQEVHNKNMKFQCQDCFLCCPDKDSLTSHTCQNILSKFFFKSFIIFFNKIIIF